jgi:hypothetical protein
MSEFVQREKVKSIEHRGHRENLEGFLESS